MGAQAEALAQQFEEANSNLLALVERLSDDQWSLTCPEGWTVAATAMHVATSHEGVAGLAVGVGTGAQLPPLTMEMLNEGNAQAAAANEHVSKQQVLETLRGGGDKAAAMIRSLSDEQLANSATVVGNQMSAKDVIAGIVIGHPIAHLQSIKTAVGG